MSSPPQHFGWVEIVFTAVIALGFGICQLWSVNREIRRDREQAKNGTGGQERDERPD